MNRINKQGRITKTMNWKSYDSLFYLFGLVAVAGVAAFDWRLALVVLGAAGMALVWLRIPKDDGRSN